MKFKRTVVPHCYHVTKISQAHKQLLRVFGTLQEIVLSSESEIESKIDALFELGVPCVEVPFSLESARSSFLKTIYEQPPSDKNQQFKDGVLWADCTKLAEKEDVILVTNDVAFYKERKYEKGLALNLDAEAAMLPNKISILNTLELLLASIQTPVQLDVASLDEAISSKHGQAMTELLDEQEFDLDEVREAHYELFATENPSQLYFTYTLGYSCFDSTGVKKDPALRVNGSGAYSPETGKFSALALTEMSVTWISPSGVPLTMSVHYMAGMATLGPRMINSLVRHPLNRP